MDTEYRSLHNEDDGPSLETKGRKPPKEDMRKGKKRLNSGRAIIVSWGLVVIIPMVLLSGLLLGLVLARSTRNSPSSSPDFVFSATNTSNPTNSYYVDINSTTLLTISAWASTLTAMLGVALMELWSYRTASRIQKLSQTSDRLGLPSPFQFVLLLQMLRGGIAVLYQDLDYLICWRGRKTRTVQLLKHSVSMLSLVSILGLLILLADTWLHLTTQTVSITQSLNSADANTTSLTQLGVPQTSQYDLKVIGNELRPHLYGNEGYGAWSMALPEICIRNETQSPLPCSLDTEYVYENAPLRNYREVLQILDGTASDFGLQTVNYTNQTIVFLAPASLPHSANYAIDFTGMTYGSSTSCTPKSVECGLKHDTGNFSAPKLDWSFDCKSQGSSFKGSQKPQIGSLLYENHTLYSDNTYASAIPWNLEVEDDKVLKWFPTEHTVNPSFPAVVMVSESMAMNFSTNNDQSEVVTIGQVAQAMVLFCENTIFDVHYAYVDESYSIINTTVSSTDVANISSIPIMLGHPRQYFKSKVDFFMVGATPEAIAASYALTYDQASMSIFGGTLTPAPATSVQYRHDRLVTRVFKAPLYTLIVLNLLYAVLGLVLTLDALRAIRRQGVQDVQARLGLAGLTAECFEQESLLDSKIDDSSELFSEKKGAKHLTIGVEQSLEGGGWRLKGFKAGKD